MTRILTFALITLTIACDDSSKSDTGDSVSVDSADSACVYEWWYLDTDGDGMGCSESGFGIYSCGAPDDGYANVGGDTDDCTLRNHE